MRFRLLVRAAAALALALSVSGNRQVRASAYTVEPCLKSRLCNTLVEHFDLGEASDTNRYGAYGNVLFELDAYNISSLLSKDGSTYAVSLAGTSTSFLWSDAPVWGAYSTAAFWFKTTSLPGTGARAAIISRDSGNNRGPGVWLYNNAGTTKLCLFQINRVADTASEFCHSQTISNGTWYYVVAGVQDSNDTPGGLESYISIGGTAKETTALNFVPHSGLGQLRIGQRPASGKEALGDYYFNGTVDQLDIFSSALSPALITLLYNSGNLRTYPYVSD